MKDTIGGDKDIVAIVRRILRQYPLCNHCLGRLFAKLGHGIPNEVRGYSLKTAITMQIHSEILEKKNRELEEELEILASNAGEPLTRLYKYLYNRDVEVKKCFICNNLLSRELFEELADKAIEYLREYNASSFLVGVSIDKDTLYRELTVASKTMLEYSESIKNEIKREVGKIVRDKTGIEPDFDRPDIVVIIDYNSLGMRVVVNPILLLGRYWKTGRNISHTIWVSRGVKKYPYSIEEFFNDRLRDVFDAERIVLHASGREDVDVRMIGTGRPMVVEVKNPRFRLVDSSLLNELLSNGVVEAVILGSASRKHIELLKTELSKKQKVYRALVYVEEGVDSSELEVLEREFRDRVVEQLTPKRILKRKKERLRTRRVYEVKTVPVADNLFEAIIRADGGLYIKELVTGDDGRTNPSFTSVLGKQAYCLELDVIGVEIALLEENILENTSIQHTRL